MATTGIGFRWLDILEKDFDKACVELDTSLTELETEEPEVVFSARQKITTLSSCFAQLTHKALTIFQNSAKLEAELVDMRAELVQARAAAPGGCQDGGDGAGNVSEAARARSEASQLARENAALRETVLALHSELFGARLATKYLDKELAGRIQQLQLLGRDMRAEVRDSLWAQVEAEILLQRHKTLVRVCRGVSPRPAAPAGPRAPRRPSARTVRVTRSPHLGLGISVTGGREHGVPILISELEAGGPAALTGQLYVGDAILAINDVDLTQACHKEAVQALQSVKGDCALCVQFIATDDDDRLSEDNYRFPLYPEDDVFEAEPDGSGATPTAPRTPDYNREASEAGSGSECVSRANSPTHLEYSNKTTEYNGRMPNDYTQTNDYTRQTNDYTRQNNDYTRQTIDYTSQTNDYTSQTNDYTNQTGDYTRLTKDFNHKTKDYVNQTNDYTRQTNEYTCHNNEYVRPVKEYTRQKNEYIRPLTADYSALNNNLDILDMDDDNIKIETCIESPRRARVGSSGDSQSTPVHTRRNSTKKKRKPQDWRTKGAYRCVEDEASSDEPPSLSAAEPLCLHTTQNHYTDEDVAKNPMPEAVPDPPEPLRVRINGETKPIRRESKGFRIGSARRVTEGGGGRTNAEGIPTVVSVVAPVEAPTVAPTLAPIVTTTVAPVGPTPSSHLLPGRGDPDFGTPV